VETKQQQVRQAKVNGEIVLEVERKKLVAAKVENARSEADAQAYALDASVRPFRDLGPAVLQMLSIQSADPQLMISLAFKEIAQNAAKIGNLNISPELLEMLMKERPRPDGS
jgi:hypothetical protein